tara:strand:+ start:1106 stop:1372 length:267 start_codon:yes stop_codon:yes gene_type:complete
MALTAEQQGLVDVQVAIEAARTETQIALENSRNSNQASMYAKQHKLETLRMAKEILVENSRTLPVDAREVTTANVTAMAAVLLNYINS